MSLGASSGPSGSGGERSREEAFWERYRQVVRKARVEDGVAVWYRRHVEGFIRLNRPGMGVRSPLDGGR
jgi:hypothetical protein